MTAAAAVVRLRRVLPTTPLRGVWLAWVLLGALFLLGTAWALHYSATRLPAPGMVARVYRGSDFAGAATVVDRDHALDPTQTARITGVDPQRSFSIEWDGVAVATVDGIHHIRARVDDVVSVWVDDQLLIEHVEPGNYDLSAAVHLTRGLHRLRIRYAQYGGDARFRLSWARPPWREHFVPVLVVPPSPELIFRRVEKALSYPTLVAVAWSLWILSGLALAVCAGCGHMARRSLDGKLKPGLVLAIGAAICLGFGLELGAAPWRGWVPDELSPKDLMYAAHQRFAGGWFHLYPPLHFYLANLVTSPFVVLSYGGWLNPGDYDVLTVMHVISRAISVVMGALTLLLVAIIAGLTIGTRLALLAAFFLLTVPPFVFYSKTTNVDIPYVFWVSVAMLMFLRATTTRALADHILLGAAVALATATKDQAYGFFPAAAAILAWMSWRDTDQLSSVTARVVATVADRRLWAGAVACLVVYGLAMGVPWNVQGVIAHFELIRKASQPYRMFAPTPDGLGQLALATTLVIPSALGLVCATFAAVGLGVALWRPRRYQMLLRLLGLAISYLVCFVAVAGYIYDRFLLGIALVSVLFAAVGFDTTMRAIPWPRARAMMTAGLLLVALWPAVSVNVRIASDSRLQLETWMNEHIDRDFQVIGSGSQMYLPNLHPFRHVIEPRPNAEALLEWNPDVIVLNAQWLDRSSHARFAVVAQSLERAGYQRVFSAGRQAEPPLWSAWVDVGASPDLFSNLDKLNPPLSVWRRY